MGRSYREKGKITSGGTARTCKKKLLKLDI